MLHGRASAFAILTTVIAVAPAARAQSVVSTHSGVVHFFEGAVYLDDQPLQSHLGRFPGMPEGAELRTGEGRAEVLLTPGVFLRMDEQSAIRMIVNDLADTQVELLAGSVIVESDEPNSGTSVTLIYQDWGVHFLRQGVYRIDSDPPQLWVRQGEVEVFAGDARQPVSVQGGMSLPFADVLVPEPSTGEPRDVLRDWAIGRGESISADNAITAQIDEDPASLTAGAWNPVYFPMLGVLSPGLDSTGLYSSVFLYQPGFNSVYLPGYTYRPLILSLVGHGFQTYLPPSRGLTGVSPGTGVVIAPLPRLPVLPLPVVPHPVAVPMRGRIGGRR